MSLRVPIAVIRQQSAVGVSSVSASQVLTTSPLPGPGQQGMSEDRQENHYSRILKPTKRGFCIDMKHKVTTSICRGPVSPWTYILAAFGPRISE